MIPVYNQIFTEEDANAVAGVVRSQFVTHIGKETYELEEKFKKICFRKYALSCANGTAGLHLALVALNLERQTIAVPACAFAAVAFAPAYLDCKTVFVDVDEKTWNIDINKLEDECKKQRIDAVIAVHNYGNPYDYYGLRELAKKYKFYIIEDACEAFGATYDDKVAGQLGDISIFSFYGNKMISGGEGGMLLTNLSNAEEKAGLFRGQAMSKTRKFWHEYIGHNFRITNMQSALVLSQLERSDKVVDHAKQVARWYKEHLPDRSFIWQKELPNSTSCWWMFSIRSALYSEADLKKLVNHLKLHNIDTRPIFPVLPDMPPWEADNRDKKFPIAKMIMNGITLPSGPGMTEEMVKEVCQVISAY